MDDEAEATRGGRTGMRRRNMLMGTGLLLGTSLLPRAARSDARPVAAADAPLSIGRSIARGDIVTTAYDPAAPRVGRYQGNGRFGCVYGPLGLHANPAERASADAYGKTQFMHMRHWGRFRFHSPSMESDTSSDYLVPLGRLYWERPFEDVAGYRQHQSFADGLLTTAFAARGARQVEVTSWFDMDERDTAGLRIAVDGESPAIVLDATEQFVPYQFGDDRPIAQTVAARRAGDEWVVETACARTDPMLRARLFVKTNAAVEPCAQGLRLRPAAGVTSILLRYGAPVGTASAAASQRATPAHWRALWERSATFDFPDDAMQAMWVRSAAYILSTFNDDGIGFAPANGLTGNLFPFNFAQDMLYVHGALLALGRVEIAKAWIERFRAMVPAMARYARRLWPEADGIYPPWELPHGAVDGFHAPAVPVVFCYEPHNAAYLARMAHDTAVMLDDPAWTAATAVPLIDGVARFYRSFCRKGADGRWHCELHPSVGQDEAGGRDQRDYLDVLYAARYSFERAVEHGLDADGAYRAILADGLAFDALRSPRGCLYTSARAGSADFGGQKHPVQLNGLAYLPVSDRPAPYERAAYALRHDITKDARKPFFRGWSLGEFLLAGTRLGDAAGWSKDWAALAVSKYGDPVGVQLYETSDTPWKAFYITTHGLVAQSLMDNVAHDYWGPLALGGCLAGPSPVRVRNLQLRSGVTISGKVGANGGTLRLLARRRCDIIVGETRFRLLRGERRTIRV